MSINLDKAFGIHAQALELRSSRAELLANNLANADTPNFKAKDFNFQTALEAAVKGQQAGLQQTHARHLRTAAYDQGYRTQYRTPLQPDTGDGNTVDADHEQTAFAQNALEYQMSLSFLNNRIQGLLRAIRGE
ncbi:MAG: flagellar basal body rod protein FlgB [Gammaproteobacteria bacterium]|nr:flagellar basal body rod protein FlgB [Gammaproteobacteria bacterium]